MQKLLWLCIAACILTACATSSGVKSYQASLADDYQLSDEERWAVKQADLYLEKLTQQGLIYRQPEAQAYIESIEARLLANDPPRYREHIRLYLARDPSVNASALANGVIFLNTGLFSALENEQQLAAILAHEIAHITERHNVKNVISTKNSLMAGHVLDVITTTAIGVGGIGYLPSALSIADHSQSAESDADQLGLQRLVAAGYPPTAMPDVFAKLQSLPRLTANSYSIFSSHPSHPQRIAELRQSIARDYASIAAPAPADNTTFTQIKALLMEQNAKMYLLRRDYLKLRMMLEQAKDSYPDSDKIAFYQGEAAWGVYQHWSEQQILSHWFNAESDPETTVKTDNNEQNSEVEETLKPQLLDNAEAFYLQALNNGDGYLPSYKRLAKIALARGQPATAESWLTRYLDSKPDARERRRLERMLEKIKTNTLSTKTHLEEK
ncbi:M48 family metalloprotease [Sinobacterium caligoides]|uniref:M48 family metalloprotease n=1 Tax=Sinobacterium caligoides TaxID=933926 RepID=UPI0013C2B4EB|nr:M48 family metalloprotease [Sinobacterium caligoides]